MAANKLATLNEKQLRKLAKIIYYQEEEAIKSIKFKSEPERAKYLIDCKANYKSVLGLLDAGGELVHKFQNDNNRAPIARDVFSHVVYCSNTALQAVRDYTLRMNYLAKIGEHSKNLVNALEELNDDDPETVTINIKSLAEEAVQHRNAMLEYTRKKYPTTASNSSSEGLKDSGLQLEDLVQKYKTKHTFDGIFKDLDGVQMIQVYDDFIKASCSGRAIVKISKFFGGFTGSTRSATFSIDGHKSYVAPMPNGEALARQIAHEN